jgi:hypothetical protein
LPSRSRSQQSFRHLRDPWSRAPAPQSRSRSRHDQPRLDSHESPPCARARASAGGRGRRSARFAGQARSR